MYSTTDPLGLNDNGQAVGLRFPTGQVVGTTIDDEDRPLAWPGAGTTGVDLGIDSGLSLDVKATALNDNGQTVGVAIGPRTTPWLLHAGTVTNLPTLAGGDAEAFAINDNGRPGHRSRISRKRERDQQQRRDRRRRHHQQHGAERRLRTHPGQLVRTGSRITV